MNKLVVWGHHVDEYMEMFDLSATDLQGKILEYGCGPSAVNAELDGQAALRISCDPLFNLDMATLNSKAALIFADMIDKVTREQDKFDFSGYGSLERFIEKRRDGVNTFFADYLSGKKAKRYQGIHEIALPFADFTFDLALSSHYLFAELYDQDIQFHIRAIKELARVAREVRIFPLIDRYGQPSSFLGPVLLDLQQSNYGAEVRSVAYHLQPEGNAMLRVWAQECPVGTGA
ncbi:class I SAM-dependent methyltransferase [Legionella spiritensis]|uniref:SAM-dependent methyltransferase n=1 Tax=Legionella spiritensis TaxID=452 RepID=A0A0W0YWX7_LEGSP|nr:hypothetical protein [Legionella spiritensis]KTD61408.1 hypothetical protein Lspi_2650 [Legionella spiritensis]SNV33463.1 SAM-dependent methyltransferase [Legionella spiritensis]VEG92389.1 SAM-dependent methyltransferase [Legionella spiritensis]